ncbi:MAG TPA: hypothetical protein VHV82_13230 [Sporichthyaceae bacterium]|nr:hypothetical protein [Sporichthyaceae bacterium]
MQQLHRQLLGPPDPPAAAWRAWAHTEPTVARALHRIDERRQNLIAATIIETTHDPQAQLLAEAMLALAIAFRESELPDIGQTSPPGSCSNGPDACCASTPGSKSTTGDRPSSWPDRTPQ